VRIDEPFAPDSNSSGRNEATTVSVAVSTGTAISDDERKAAS
jgi:hypothetical protein